MLDSPIVRSMLTSAREAMTRHQLEFPEISPDLLVLIEMGTKENAISLSHDPAYYQVRSPAFHRPLSPSLTFSHLLA